MDIIILDEEKMLLEESSEIIVNNDGMWSILRTFEDIENSYPIFVEYKGIEIRKANTWKKMYVELVKLLIIEFPELTKVGKICEKSRNVDLGNNTYFYIMKTPRKVSNHLYLETNLTNVEILERIVILLNRCTIGSKNIRINCSHDSNNNVQKDQNTNFMRINSHSKFESQDKEFELKEGRRIDDKKYDLFETQEDEDRENKIELYRQILSEKFVTGYRLNSQIELKRFKKYWEEIHKEKNNNTDKEILSSIILCGISYEDKIFEVNSMLKSEIKEKLINYLQNSFEAGTRAIFYENLFQEFFDDFWDEHIYNNEMLKLYLRSVCEHKYVFEKNYMTNEKNFKIDITEDIKNCLLEVGAPIQYAELFKRLPHISEKKIKQILHTDEEFLSNGAERYFHISVAHFSDKDLENIKKIIILMIKEKGFISANELIDVITQKYSYIIENNSLLSKIGLRGAIRYKFNSDFSFKGNIISSIDQELSMENVFEEFCKGRDSFTLGELKVLKKELETGIYFEVVYDNSLRISMEDFVSKDQANFNVAEIDNAIEKLCLNDYIPICGLNQFSILPYCGFAWNSYLLEHYVDKYSKKFKLIHTNFNENSSVGAIVKEASQITTFEELIIDVLAESAQELNSKVVLNFLCEKGYMARRSYSNIEQVLIKARERRNQKGN